MERPVAAARAARVRSVIAHAMLDGEECGAARGTTPGGATPTSRPGGMRAPMRSAPPTLGTVTLREHQRSAVARLRVVMREHGGALLADDAGLGKTYVAAALAAEAEQPLIVAPASLRAMWETALRETGVAARLTSYAALSRGRLPPGRFDLLVLDEAHHARTPGTRRYARLAELSRAARVLLLSATPVHNSRRDLAALCALFLGERAWSMDEHALAPCIVRRERADVAESVHLPRLAAPRWIAVGDDEAVLHAILALPPPLPPRDGGDGGALLAWSLARQWASSRAALAGALRRRLARAAALGAALESGRHPSRGELASWSFSGGALQLAFPELVVSHLADKRETLLATVRAHERGVQALLSRITDSADPDAARAGALLAVRAAHPHEKVIAFTQFADTARMLYSRLSRTAGVAVLTAQGATVAGGTLARREAIARFAPAACSVPAPPEAERIDLLITTDLLSEGINLQDASVVVHLDLPWTPARLEQRVGRSRRIGAHHARTSVYALAPPAAAESLLRVEARLREKLRAAGRAVGIAGAILPPIAGVVDGGATSAARHAELLRQLLHQWLGAGDAVHGHGGTTEVAAVRAERDGMLALLLHRDRPRLIATLGEAAACSAATDAGALLLAAARLAAGEDVPVSDSALARAHEAVAQWMVRCEVERAAGGVLSMRARPRRQAIQRIAAITARAPQHRRPLLASLAAQARQAAVAPYGIGEERVLGQLVAASMSDEAWLRALGTFGSLHIAPEAHGDGARPQLVALLLLQRSPCG